MMDWNPKEIEEGMSQQDIKNLPPAIRQAMANSFAIQMAMEHIPTLVHTPGKMLFLDLEETIIRSMSNPVLCNVDWIKYILHSERVTEVHIFSFALFSQLDQDVFSVNIRAGLEEVLGVRIRSWPSIKQMNKAIRKFTGVVVGDWEFTQHYDKLRAFQTYCRAQYKDMECVLVDDVVPNSILTFPDDKLVIRTIKAPAN